MKEKIKVRLFYFSLSLLGTVLITRLFLYFYPFANLNIGPYNIHHLYIGVVLLIGTYLLLLAGIGNVLLTILSGIGIGLILDQIVFLIATDGADLTYLGSASLWGAIISTLTVLLIVGGIYYGFVQKRK